MYDFFVLFAIFAGLLFFTQRFEGCLVTLVRTLDDFFDLKEPIKVLKLLLTDVFLLLLCMVGREKISTIRKCRVELLKLKKMENFTLDLYTTKVSP